jgi:hypothetical protein
VAQETTLIEAEPNPLPPACATVLNSVQRPAPDSKPSYKHDCDNSADEALFHAHSLANVPSVVTAPARRRQCLARLSRVASAAGSPSRALRSPANSLKMASTFFRTVSWTLLMVMREYTNGDCYSSLTHSSPESKCVNARMSLLKTVGEQFAALLLKAKKRQRLAHSKTLREVQRSTPTPPSLECGSAA